MARIRKKLNKSALILLALLAAGAIVLIVCGVAGLVDLSPISGFIMGAAEAMTTSTWMAAVGFGVSVLAGFGIGLWAKDYIIGMETNTAPIVPTSGSYNPLPSQPSSTQSDVVVS